MKIQAKSSYSLIPEGEQVLRIKDIDTKDFAKFQKLVVNLEDADGITARENFSFVKEDGAPNEVAESIFNRMGRAALGDETLDEFETDDLIGCFVRVEVEHNTGTKGGTFANIAKWIGPADKFDKAPAKSAACASSSQSKSNAADLLAKIRAGKK